MPPTYPSIPVVGAAHTPVRVLYLPFYCPFPPPLAASRISSLLLNIHLSPPGLPRSPFGTISSHFLTPPSPPLGASYATLPTLALLVPASHRIYTPPSLSSSLSMSVHPVISGRPLAPTIQQHPRQQPEGASIPQQSSYKHTPARRRPVQQTTTTQTSMTSSPPSSVRLTRTGRVSKAKKGLKVHVCENCGKVRCKEPVRVHMLIYVTVLHKSRTSKVCIPPTTSRKLGLY